MVLRAASAAVVVLVLHSATVMMDIAQLRRSQIPRSSLQKEFEPPRVHAGIDPRVGDRSTPIPGAPNGAKSTGRGPSIDHWSNSRKRAYRGARRRAEQVGGTWYRGSWSSARSLGVSQAGMAPSQEAATVKAPPKGRPRPRLHVISMNIGGFTQELYDTFLDWLDSRCGADVIIVQETHWGLGKEEKRWLLPNWLVISAPDANNRYSGVAVFARRSRLDDSRVSHVTWMPGRLLHLRHTSQQATLDIVAGYQFVRQSWTDAKTQQQRHSFWTKLGLLLKGLPSRNVLVLGADLNTANRPLAGLTGRGVMHTARGPDLEMNCRGTASWSC